MADQPSSNYAKFMLAFQGSNLKNMTTGKIYRKPVFYDLFRNEALKSIKSRKCPEGFSLVDNPAYMEHLKELSIIREFRNKY